MTAAIQTIWSELLVATLADAGIATAVISPGSRSTPSSPPRGRAAPRARDGHRRTRRRVLRARRRARDRAPAALVCTSGTAAAHYLPAIIEASLAGVPLVVITADRPPELQACGASQTIDQLGLYGGFVRGAFDLGAPVGQVPALRGLRRKLVQAITLARGPHAGPVHLEVPLRKPLEPALPTHRRRTRPRPRRPGPAWTGGDRAAAPRRGSRRAHRARGRDHRRARRRDRRRRDARSVRRAPRRRVRPRRARRLPVLAEAGSQLRFGPRPAGVAMVDHVDLIPAAQRPAPRLILQLGSEPVAASWPAWLATIRAQRWVLGGATWADPDSAAHRVILGDVGAAIAAIGARLSSVDRSAAPASFGDRENTVPGIGASAAPTLIADRRSSSRIRTTAWLDTWRDLEVRAASAIDRAIDEHDRNESPPCAPRSRRSPSTA